MLTTTWRRFVVLFCFVFASACFSIHDASAQNDFDSLLGSGEFTVALDQAAAQTDPQVRDHMYQQIAQAQRAGDTGLNAFSTLAMVQDDDLRFGSYDQLTNYHRGNDGMAGGGGAGGLTGGITEADFEELMDLIQETIDPDSWEENGGVGRMSPFPTGVWIDSAGTLKQIERDKSGRLDQLRETTSDPIEDATLLQETELRKISLARLERELVTLDVPVAAIADTLAVVTTPISYKCLTRRQHRMLPNRKNLLLRVRHLRPITAATPKRLPPIPQILVLLAKCVFVG